MKQIVVHDRYSNEPIVLIIDAISHITKRIYIKGNVSEEFSTLYVSNFCFDVNESIDNILTKIEHAETEGNNKKIYNFALRVYDDKSGGEICGNCLGYVNRDYNYCPQCGCKLED